MKKSLALFIVLTLGIYATGQQTSNFDLKVFFEGSFNGIDMNTDLNNDGLIPLSQPFNTAPWNYEGTESVVVIPNGDVVDWVLFELRETSGNASTAIPDSIIARQAAFILKNGQITGLDGISLPEFDLTIMENLFVVLWYRNHLALMSSSPLIESKGTFIYDFTDNISKAYLDGQKDIGNGYYGMIVGDSDGNGIIDEDDMNNSWSMNAGEQGYYLSDLNNDGEIDNIDKDDYWYVNLGSYTKVPSEIVLNCGGQILDIDGNTYNTVLIGTQCWMADNLKTTTYSNGTPIPNVTDDGSWASLTSGAYVWFNNDIAWKDNYGALYNWYAVDDINGLCPAGWHVPSHFEWIILTDFIGGTVSPHGNELKSCKQVNSPLGGACNTVDHPRWNEHDTHYGSDDYGFSGLPGGYRSNIGPFGNIGGNSYWWSSTATSSNSAQTRYLYNSLGNVGVSYISRISGLSVRCLRD